MLLSGADYPIKPAHVILRDLDTGGYDAHISHELIQPSHFERDWQRECHERYRTRRLFFYPAVTRSLRIVKREARLRSPRLTRPFLPFSDNVQNVCWRPMVRRKSSRGKADHRYRSLTIASGPALSPRGVPRGIIFSVRPRQCAAPEASQLRLSLR